MTILAEVGIAIICSAKDLTSP